MAPCAYHLCQIMFSVYTSRLAYKTSTSSMFSTITLIPKSPTTSKTFSHIFQECSGQRAVGPGKQAHARMIVSGFDPTAFVSNCLIQVYVRCSTLEYAFKVFKQMPHKDTVSWNSMVFGYSGCRKMELAQSVFDTMPHRDVISWNSLISGYLQNGDFQISIDLFLQMGRVGVSFDRTTFAVVLKACSALEDYTAGIQIHGLVIHLGFDRDVVTGSALVDMYAKCKRLDNSIRYFYEMPEKNSVSWSAVIAGCVQNNVFIGGLELFLEMQKAGVEVSQSTYASILRASAGLSAINLGSQLHCHSLKTDYGSDVIVGTATLDMYAKCGYLLDAHKLFNLMPHHNLQSFNAIIVGYVQSFEGYKALQLFQLLQKSGLGFDEVSLSGAFSACAVIKAHLEGLQLHGLVIKSKFHLSICVANAILDMYGKCGALVEAQMLFNEMVRRDAVSWNAIIAAHEQNESEEETLSLFVWMLRSGMEPDDFTYGSVLKACAGLQVLNYGVQVHGRITKSTMGLDVFVLSALVDMYCKCGMMGEAEMLHSGIQKLSKVSWNAIISGFSLQKQSEEAQKVFFHMLEMGVEPDHFTYATVLDTCANLASGGLGKQIHAQIVKQELQSDVYISSTLVDMYSKCGNMQDSRLVFEKASKRDFVTWNAMISGYAQHGLAADALQIYENMQLENVKPNHATFVAVLRACGHMGLVEKGWCYFSSMSNDHGLEPQLEHYSCMVDIMGRSGQFMEALKLISDMPFEADDVVWRTLLSTCKLHRNVEVAEKAAASILQLEPNDSSAFILLSNIYADVGMWDEVSKMRKIMRLYGLKKEPGCSWIEIMTEMHTFLIGDKAHPQCKEIYDNLNLLISEMRRLGYVPDADLHLIDEEEDQHEWLQEPLLCMQHV